jgi:hypothetical protein
MEVFYGLMLIVIIIGTVLVLRGLAREEYENARSETVTFLEGPEPGRSEPGRSIYVIVGAAIILPCFLIIANNYVGNERIVAVVKAINKSTSDVKRVSVDLSGGFEQERTNDILRPYEVAVTPVGTKDLFILKNDNTLWRAKFNKREIQLQLEPGKKYRIYVHRLFFRRNVLKVEQL